MNTNETLKQIDPGSDLSVWAKTENALSRYLKIFRASTLNAILPVCLQPVINKTLDVFGCAGVYWGEKAM